MESQRQRVGLSQLFKRMKEVIRRKQLRYQSSSPGQMNFGRTRLYALEAREKACGGEKWRDSRGRKSKGKTRQEISDFCIV